MPREFEEFRDCYGFKYAEDLVGRCALVLYEDLPVNKQITGIIPLGSSRRDIQK